MARARHKRCSPSVIMKIRTETVNQFPHTGPATIKEPNHFKGGRGYQQTYTLPNNCEVIEPCDTTQGRKRYVAPPEVPYVSLCGKEAKGKSPRPAWSHYMAFLRKPRCRDRTQTGGCRGLGVERREEFGGEENVLFCGCGGGSVTYAFRRTRKKTLYVNYTSVMPTLQGNCRKNIMNRYLHLLFFLMVSIIILPCSLFMCSVLLLRFLKVDQVCIPGMNPVQSLYFMLFPSYPV